MIGKKILGLVTSLSAVGVMSTGTSNSLGGDFIENVTGTNELSGYVDGKENKRIVAYYPEWGIYGGHKNYYPDYMPYEKITHVNYAFIDLDANGNVLIMDDYAATEAILPGQSWSDEVRGVFGQLMQAKEDHPHLKVMLSIGGWSRSANFPLVAADDTKIDTFANSAIALMEKYGFDGIDIDWEYPGDVRDADLVDNPNDTGHPHGTPEDGQNYENLLRVFREKLDNKAKRESRGYELSIAAPASEDKSEQMNIEGISPYLDFINLMTYDMHGAYEDTTNHHAAIYPNLSDPSGDDKLSAENTVNYYLENGATRDQLVVGTPYYSRGWQGVQNDGPIAELPGLYATSTKGGANGIWDGGVAAGVNPYWHMKELEQDPRFTKYRDPIAKVPYLYSEELGEMYTYEDEISIAERSMYIMNEDLGGSIIWTIDADSPLKSENPELTTAMYDVFYNDGEIPEEPVVETPDNGINDGTFHPEIGVTEPGETPVVPESPETPQTSGDRKLIGYLHNWYNASQGGQIALKDVVDEYDVIHIAFLDVDSMGNVEFNDGGKNGNIVTPESVKELVAQGKDVTFSIGGQLATVTLDTEEKIQNFINSYIRVADEYGVNGIDIDIEHGIYASGSYGMVTAAQQGVIDVANGILDYYGEDFTLYMAPESANVMGGKVAYGGAWGNYLPILDALRDRLTGLHVQFYNTGSLVGLDGKVYSQATADYTVAMSDLLIKGFNVAGGEFFEGFDANIIMAGLPATINAAPAGGYMSNDEILKAVTQLVTNERTTSYDLDTSHENYGGIMTWSINWDNVGGNEFSKGVRSILDNLGEIESPVVPETPEEPENELPDNGINDGTHHPDWGVSEPEVTPGVPVEPETPEIPDYTGSWDFEKVYNTGDMVTYNDKTYRAKWWTKGDIPEENDVWERLSGSDEEEELEYNSNQVYRNGDIVIYDGKRYVAKYWTRGNVPSESDAFTLLDIEVDSDGYEIYIETKVYNTGDMVNYNGRIYRAKWWTKGNLPNSSVEWEFVREAS